MTDYTELAKALREQSGPKCTDPICSKECDQYKECGTRIIQDAADAIEELKAIAHSHCVAASAYWEELEELKAKLPKLGEWIDDEFGAKCSYCGKYAYWSKFEIPWKSPYCPNCGAKMEVQE